MTRPSRKVQIRIAPMLSEDTERSQRALMLEIAELKRQLAQERTQKQRLFRLALLASLLIHGAVLLIPTHKPQPERTASRLEATLAQAPRKPLANPPPAPESPPQTQPPQRTKQAPAPTSKKILAVEKAKGSTSASAPRWSVAQKKEMDDFLRELDTEAQSRPKPTLAQKALADAREYARHTARQEQEGSELLELIPNAPPVDPFSLEMYLDSLVKKLNRSAAFVANDPRRRGVKRASVQVSLNPDGSLRQFRILNAGDQEDQIAYIRAVVERAVPFAAFPRDLRRSASALQMTICILPGTGDGGLGFSRLPDGRSC